MSHPDPLFDPENCEDDDMNYADNVDTSNYDDYNDFHDGVEVSNDEWEFGDESDALLAAYFLDRYDSENSGGVDWDDETDDSMDGDIESGLASAGHGMDENYGYYGEDNYYGEDY